MVLKSLEPSRFCVVVFVVVVVVVVAGGVVW